MSSTDSEASARAAITAVAQPGDPVMSGLLAQMPAVEVWAALRARRALPAPPGKDDASRAAHDARMRRWQEAAAGTDPDDLVARAADLGIRLVLPGEPEWPGQLDSLAGRRPVALWVRGTRDLRHCCLRSVAVVGSRAASAYGLHVAGEFAHGLAERGWTVVSGGAYGIDGAAHRGALATGGPTVVVLACGLDTDYPRGHANLFAAAAERGVLVSEHPPGTTPTRHGFLVRNRLIAALTPGTVVVEAGLRSGAASTAKHARELCRMLMAVPGPVTSALSAGCHRLLRDCQAVCVTCVADIIEQVGPIGADLCSDEGTVIGSEELDPLSRRLLEAVPSRSGGGTATIAMGAGVDLDTALRHLGLLAAGGFVERAGGGWRLRRP
ncbi:DNA-processing protein DprA [Marinactinospora thermotolerans]|uniref:DNA protecting protein DprA n=1 Tax=Marinactinospora thermotolerans DSM 45154 TaxID=1122192 RepID=A0A1T4SH34_9ACTN|nr:DNA-processing protein DprA [Marinactinospora thermotolerans]SKA27248.1 DNA protecting protein DprA [Marinactinospora thermotolerans DSM 45154]